MKDPYLVSGQPCLVWNKAAEKKRGIMFFIQYIGDDPIFVDCWPPEDGELEQWTFDFYQIIGIGWINVKDRWPPVESRRRTGLKMQTRPYLVSDGKKVMVGAYTEVDGEKRFRYVHSQHTIPGITYWAFLPEPPE